MSPYELLENINEIYNDEETIIVLNELIREIENDPKKYINKLFEELEDFSSSKHLCPLCSGRLITKSYEESRGEYQGLNCSETMYERECSNPECSYTER